MIKKEGEMSMVAVRQEEKVYGKVVALKDRLEAVMDLGPDMAMADLLKLEQLIDQAFEVACVCRRSSRRGPYERRA